MGPPPGAPRIRHLGPQGVPNLRISAPDKNFLFRIGCVIASLKEYILCTTDNCDRAKEGNVRDSKQANLQPAEVVNETGN